jgi:TRAP-type C4-dicarboxylate transport system substrate-binding protein
VIRPVAERVARRRLVTLACVATLAAAGCSTGGTKAGPASPTVVLHLATPENPDAPYADDVRFFAGRVRDLTDGEVAVRIDFQAIRWTPESEGKLFKMVRDGGTDLALVPPRAFDTVGVTGFEALQAPMLIDSPEVAGAVATSDLANELLDGLEEHGVVGLGLAYEGLRVPLALNGAVTRVSDFGGLLIRVPSSDLSDRIMRALRAVPDRGASHVVATTGASYPLVETELALAPTNFPDGGTVTSNMVFFPKYDALLANADAFDRLAGDQAEALRRVAAETVARSVQTVEDEQELASTLCADGGHVVEAPADEVEAMRTALQPVLDDLRKDPATRVAIDRIATLAETTQAPAFTMPPACLPPSGDAARLPSQTPAPTP